MIRKRGKVTISTTVSRFADDCIEEMVKSEKFSNRSNAVESSMLLMFFVLNNDQIMRKAKEMEIVQ